MNTESFKSTKRSFKPAETDFSTSMTHIDFKQFNYPTGLDQTPKTKKPSTYKSSTAQIMTSVGKRPKQ